MKDDLDTHRLSIINRLYELILNPDETNDFIAVWEAYISELSSKYDDRQNSTGLSDVILPDDGLEIHFARVYAILETLGRNREQLEKNATALEAGALFKFDQQGQMLLSPDPKFDTFRPVKCATDVQHLLDFEAAADWQAYLTKAQRAPDLVNLRIFELRGGGNLIAYSKRDESSGEVHIFVSQLTVAWSLNLKGLLKEHFQLTKGELMLVEELSVYGSLEIIAKHNDRAKNTLRSQLKSIFKKMNVGSQAAVLQSIAVISQFCENASYEAPKNTNAPDLGELIEVNVGGVPVPVHLFGPKDGHPIVFIHGMLDGVALNKSVVKALYKFNLRFISPVRPNFGAASSQPDLEKAPEIFAQHLKGVICQLGLRSAFLLGHMSGGLYAFAASSVLRGNIAGIINISCGVPILSTKQFSNLSKRQKAFAYTTRYAPAILPALLRAGIAQIDSARIESLMDDMYPAVSPDRDLLEKKPEIAAVVLDGYRFAVAQGYKGFQSDALQVTRNWSDYVNSNDKPVLLIHGHHDPAAAYEYVPPFAEREGIEIVAYPDDGQLILYGKPNQVLENIRDFIDRNLIR